MPRCPLPVVQPDPSAPMRLADAAALFGLTASGLRTEARRGNLVISRVAGKDWVTKAEIERMFERCRLVPETGRRETQRAVPSEPSADDVDIALAAARATIERL